MRRAAMITMICGLTLGACGQRDIGLRELARGDEGPEEFAVLPVKPLSMPENLNTLPAPTPGAANLVDPNPKGDAIAALGGRVRGGAGIPAADGAVVRHASRYGVPGDIRQSLAQEDLEFRTRMSRFTKLRVVKVDRYPQAYRRLALDAFREAERFRRAGIPVPSSPPGQRR